jgi:hypothetical protein
LRYRHYLTAMILLLKLTPAFAALAIVVAAVALTFPAPLYA